MISMSSFVIVPVVNNPEQTARAIDSAVGQVGIRNLTVLAVNRSEGKLATISPLRSGVVWITESNAPSLAACWNHSLDLAWEHHALDALVINNDVELPPDYYIMLRQRMEKDHLLFLSGIGVHQWGEGRPSGDDGGAMQLHPDFSAFVITKECHRRYRFDEGFIPAYCEDVDYHRRLLLDEQGQHIGKINIPFLHTSSGTVKSMTDEEALALKRAVDQGARRHYERKWGAGVNEETQAEPFGERMSFDVTTGRLRTLAEQRRSVREYLEMMQVAR